MKSKNVTDKRWKYIGGSDIPIIMGISPFKKRYDLLLEKARLKVAEEVNNIYIDYGNVMESEIRDYLNEKTTDKFYEDTIINEEESIRCNVDGINKDTILEIKTTSKIHQDINDYKIYLVQLLFYMMNYNYSKGLLAVYERAEDLSPVLNADKLQLFNIDIKDYEILTNQITQAVIQFKIDLDKINSDPFITEQDLVPADINFMAAKIEELEKKLKETEELIKQRDEFKAKLHNSMSEYGIKSWTLNSGTIITNVLDGEDKEVNFFNEDKFMEENEELYKKYVDKKVKKGRKGYVAIRFK